MSTWRDVRDDPSTPLLVVCAGAALAGLGLIGLAWAGASNQLFLTLQLPWLVSGGFGGLALTGLGASLVAVQHRRRSVALHVVQLDRATLLAHRVAHQLELRRGGTS